MLTVQRLTCFWGCLSQTDIVLSVANWEIGLQKIFSIGQFPASCFVLAFLSRLNEERMGWQKGGQSLGLELHLFAHTFTMVWLNTDGWTAIELHLNTHVLMSQSFLFHFLVAEAVCRPHYTFIELHGLRWLSQANELVSCSKNVFPLTNQKQVGALLLSESFPHSADWTQRPLAKSGYCLSTGQSLSQGVPLRSCTKITELELIQLLKYWLVLKDPLYVKKIVIDQTIDKVLSIMNNRISFHWQNSWIHWADRTKILISTWQEKKLVSLPGF